MTHASEMTCDQRVQLLDRALEDLRCRHAAGTVLIGGQEAGLLWQATVDAFVAGNWVATLLCAHATCERVLAGLVSLHELPGHADPAPNGWESWGLGKLIGHVRRQGWIEPDVLDDVAALSERRKPFGHWRRPLDAGTPGRRMADSVMAGNDEPDELAMRLLAGDAHAAATTALRVYFGNYFGGPFAPASTSWH